MDARVIYGLGRCMFKKIVDLHYSGAAFSHTRGLLNSVRDSLFLTVDNEHQGCVVSINTVPKVKTTRCPILRT